MGGQRACCLLRGGAAGGWATVGTGRGSAMVPPGALGVAAPIGRARPMTPTRPSIVATLSAATPTRDRLAGCRRRARRGAAPVATAGVVAESTRGTRRWRSASTRARWASAEVSSCVPGSVILFPSFVLVVVGLVIGCVVRGRSGRGRRRG